MKRTRVSTLVVLLVFGAGAGGLLQVALAAAGRPIVMLPVTLPLAFAAIGAIVVTLAVPIRKMTRGSSRGPVDPFYATRVVMLAKASSLSGALTTGAGLGMLVYLLSRSVMPGVGSVGAAVASIGGAAVLLVCGLIAEFMCRIPPSDDGEGDGNDENSIDVRT